MAFRDIFKRFGGKVLFYPGCLLKTKFKKEFDNYKEIFKRLKVDYILFDEENCCGLHLLNAGYKKEAHELFKKNYTLFKKRKVSKIITSCPYCYYTFKVLCPRYVKEWDIPVEHVSLTIYNALNKARISLDKSEVVSYHDPCYLGRYLGEYEIPRKVIEILGGDLVEPIKTKEEALCCGGGLKQNYPEISKEAAKLRISHFPEEAKNIITLCEMCFLNLREVDERVIDFSTYVVSKLRKMG